jgi:hypothetical protein
MAGVTSKLRTPPAHPNPPEPVDVNTAAFAFNSVSGDAGPDVDRARVRVHVLKMFSLVTPARPRSW